METICGNVLCCIAIRKASVSLQGFGLRAGLSASVTDLTDRPELVKETGGGRETGESVQYETPCDVCVLVCERETERQTANSVVLSNIYCHFSRLSHLIFLKIVFLTKKVTPWVL